MSNQETITGVNEGPIAKQYRKAFRDEVDPILKTLATDSRFYNKYVNAGFITMRRCMELSLTFVEWANKQGIAGTFDFVGVYDSDETVDRECQCHIVLRHKETGELIDLTNAIPHIKPFTYIDSQQLEDHMIQQVVKNVERLKHAVSLLAQVAGVDLTIDDVKVRVQAMYQFTPQWAPARVKATYQALVAA